VLKENLLKYLPEGSLLHKVSTLVSGAAAGQIAMIVALPLLTRLYSPEDFGVLGVYTTIVLIFGSIASFRYELAIPLPRNAKIASGIFQLATACVISTSICLTIFIVLYIDKIPVWLNLPDIYQVLWFVPLGVLISGLYQVFSYWEIRRQSFSLIASAKMQQGVMSALSQTSFGALGLGANGVVAGALIGQSIGFFRLFRKSCTKKPHSLSNVNIRKIKKLAIIYNRFPKYSILDTLANNCSTYLPIIIITAYEGAAEAGFLVLTMRIMQLPMNLVGSAVSQVYLADAPEKLRAGCLKEFTSEVLVNLVKIAVIPTLLLFSLGGEIIPFFFGVDWVRSAELLIWVAPWFLFQLLSSPISMVMHVKKKQKELLFLNLYGFVIRVVGLGVVILLEGGSLSEGYAIASAFYYFLVFIVCTRIVGLGLVEYTDVVKRCSAFFIVGGAVFLAQLLWIIF